MFKKVLVANRGEIALRVICACRELGIRTVAVFSEADRDSLHVRFADEAVCVGPARSSESYLNVPSVISAAEVTDVDAVHPGYGYLAENAYFAEVCEACNVRFIGPSPQVIRLMGDKARARARMVQAGLAVLPGSRGALESLDQALEVASGIGYPVIVKAAAGGGGRGMRIVRSPGELSSAFSMAENEARLAFGVPDLYLEKYLEKPRHIEFQVMGDRHGKVVHFGERECSIQRRHQKLIEESPSVIVDEDIRERIGRQVEVALAEVGYSGAGTVEFLVDEDRNFYFMEMNTRIQVEHPVTEMVAGVDLVKLQIRMAAGEPLELEEPPGLRGHSIECRINAEDPETFRPSPGRITVFHVPGGTGVRVDTAVYSECEVPPYYDSLIAKLVVHAPSRPEAVRRMERALEMFIVEGVSTSIPLHQRIMKEPDFLAGRLDTGFMERYA